MRPDIVCILSGGWSASQVDLTQLPGVVIAVNNAVLHAPRVDHAVTMDRRWAEAYWPWLKVQNEKRRLHTWLRRNNISNIPERPDWLTVYKDNHRSFVMNNTPGHLNGTNSGGVALNLAYHLRPFRLYLFGFDYRPGPMGEPHWFEQTGKTDVVGAFTIHTRRYAAWADEFQTAGSQFKNVGIQVFNVSDISIVTAFPKLSPKAFAKGLA